MKPGVHPDYHPVVFRDANTGAMFPTRSTMTSARIVEVTSDSHLFWTGGRRILDTAGQVEKFHWRYGTQRSA
jgi:large subunit ribosomal protein L31